MPSIAEMTLEDIVAHLRERSLDFVIVYNEPMEDGFHGVASNMELRMMRRALVWGLRHTRQEPNA